MSIGSALRKRGKKEIKGLFGGRKKAAPKVSKLKPLPKVTASKRAKALKKRKSVLAEKPKKAGSLSGSMIARGSKAKIRSI